jgi:predicted dehydrogenase
MEEMIEACRRHRVQFMDGVMFMHHPRLKRFRATLDDAEYFGELTRIDSALTFSPANPADYFAQDIRLHSVLEPLGCLGDVGWYTIRFSLWAANWKTPRQVGGRILAEHGRPDSPAPVPTDFSGDLIFDGGASAGFHCSFRAWRQMWGMISGTRATLHIPDFVIPADDDPIGNPLSQQTRMIRTFSDLVRGGKPDEFWSDIALQTQRVMMACEQSARSGGKLITLA